jgi:5'-deoxynucleotidase YfbR-like HD superfamily hydrolase
MAIAVLNNETRLKEASMNISARQAELNKPGEMERINKEYERRLKTEGQEAADAYKARMLQFKGIEARAGVTDDDLQKTYFKQIEGMYGTEKKEFLKRFPTYKEFIEYQRTRAAQGGGSAQPSGQVDTRNPLLAG